MWSHVSARLARTALTFESALPTSLRPLCQVICTAEAAQRWLLVPGPTLVSFAGSESLRLSLGHFYSDSRSGKTDM